MDGKSYKNAAIKGVYWMGILSASNVVVKLLITMILSRILAPSEFGVVAAVQVVISFAEIFWMMGVGPAIIQKDNLTYDDIKTGNSLNVIFGSIVYFAIFIFAGAISKFVGIESISMLRCLSVVFLIHSFSGVSESLLQKDMEFKVISIINVSSIIVYGMFSIVFALIGFGAWALVIGQITQVLFKTVLSIYKKPIGFNIKINSDSAKSLMYFGVGFTLSRVFNNLATQGDYFVVSRTLGSVHLGFYNRAYQILMVPTNVIGTVMDKVLFPLLSRYQKQHEKVRYVFLNITAMIAMLALPITVFSIIMGEDLVYLILGPNWGSTVLPFKLLIISLFFRMAYKICDALVRSMGAVYKRLWVQILYSIIVILGAYIGKEWGIVGVAISTSIAIFTNYVVMLMLIKKLVNLKLSELVRYLAPGFIGSFFIALLIYYLSFYIFIFSNALIRLTTMTIILVGLYLVAYKYVLLRFMPLDFHQFLDTIIQSSIGKIFAKIKKDKEGKSI